MRKKEYLFLTFFLFLFFSIAIYFLDRTAFFRPIRGLLDKVTTIFAVSIPSSKSISEQDKAKEEIHALLQKLSHMNTLEKDNQALKDQFESSQVSTSQLLPAHVISAPEFIPGRSFPQIFIIDQGEESGVKKGQGVIVKNNLIGIVSEVSLHLAKVTLVTNNSSSFTAKTQKSAALGVLKGKKNNEMFLDNVVLSDTLEVDDIVVTMGEANTDVVTIPSNLVIGKIVSVDKRPSALFQTAEVKSLLDFTKLSVVFVVVK